MDYQKLQTVFTANKDRLAAVNTYWQRYQVTNTDHVSSSIRGYSEARRADLVLIPNNFEGEIVDNINSWAFSRGFTINSDKEDDLVRIYSNIPQYNDLKVIAKDLGRNALAVGSSLLVAYTDMENLVRFYVPEPEMTAFITDSFGNISEFVFFYYKQELEGYRLYADAFDDNEITYFKATATTKTAWLSSLPSMEIIETKPHNFKKSPAVVLDMKYPAFYKVIGLIDAYNKLLTETNDQFSAFKAVILALRNLMLTDEDHEKLTTDAKAKEAYDKIMKMSVYFLREDGEANFLKREVQVEAFTALEEVLRANIDRFSGNVNYSDPEVMGRATNLAINTRTKPISNKAQDLTDRFQMCFREMLRIVNEFWKIQKKDIDIDAVTIQFNYDKPANQVEEATTVQNLINSGVPKKYAYSQFSGFSDPEAVAEEAQKEDEKRNQTDTYTKGILPEES